MQRTRQIRAVISRKRCAACLYYPSRDAPFTTVFLRRVRFICFCFLRGRRKGFCTDRIQRPATNSVRGCRKRRAERAIDEFEYRAPAAIVLKNSTVFVNKIRIFHVGRTLFESRRVVVLRRVVRP